MQGSIFGVGLLLIILISGCVSPPTENIYLDTKELASTEIRDKKDLANDSKDKDTAFLEQGFKALAEGDHISAVKFFQRHSRKNDTLAADWEASIAIAYVSMLPGSPFYDMKAVRMSYMQLSAWSIDDSSVNSQVILMRDALEAFVSLHRQVTDLERDNELLEENLAKRESALRRLRELTLGQQREVAQ